MATQDTDPNPGMAPADPRSDPEHKLGQTPPPEELAEDAAIQRNGRAARSALRNANVPHPAEDGGPVRRDPQAEGRLP